MIIAADNLHITRDFKSSTVPLKYWSNVLFPIAYFHDPGSLKIVLKSNPR